MGGPVYGIGMIDRWAWLAHGGPLMCCFYHVFRSFYVVAWLYWGLLCCSTGLIQFDLEQIATEWISTEVYSNHHEMSAGPK